MKPRDFVHAVKIAVYDAAIYATSQVLSRPPGRKPSDNLQAVSEWFKGLSDSERTNVNFVIELATFQAVFGMLAVLDGVRQIESRDSQGQLKLLYIKNGKSVLINCEDRELLHDLLAQEIQLKL